MLNPMSPFVKQAHTGVLLVQCADDVSSSKASLSLKGLVKCCLIEGHDSILGAV